MLLQEFRYTSYTPLENFRWRFDGDIKRQSRLATDPVTEPLSNFMNNLHFSKISIGTSPQDFEVFFNTGFSNFWVLSINCNVSNQAYGIYHYLYTLCIYTLFVFKDYFKY